MHVGSGTSDSDSNLLFVNFNQDFTALTVGTKSGYKFYSLTTLDNFEPLYENDTKDICIVDRLFSSSLAAIVSLSAPRKLKVCHFKRGSEICNYSYSNTILAVKLNRVRLIVCLEDSIYIHNIRDMKVLHTITDIPVNPRGVCALSISNDNCYLAYPASNLIGEVQIFDAVHKCNVVNIHAHHNPLVSMAFNPTANKIATASDKGTVIRVFSVPEGQKLFEFRRGMKRCATIYSLSFSQDSNFLCCSSNTETIHIFKLETVQEKPVEEPQGWMDYFSGALKTSANYLPSQVSDMWTQGRAFANARLPQSGLKNVSAITNIQRVPHILVACEDGFLYYFNFNTIDGGECSLIKQQRFDGVIDVSSRSVGTFQSAGLETTPHQAEGISEAAKLPEHVDTLNLDDEDEFPPVVHKN